MADEITVRVGLSFSKSGDSETWNPPTFTVDMAGLDSAKLTQTIGTSEEALNIGDITTAGYILIENTDATNYVEIRAGSGAADVVKIKAGEFALFRLASSTPYAIADTASCVVKYLLLED